MSIMKSMDQESNQKEEGIEFTESQLAMARPLCLLSAQSRLSYVLQRWFLAWCTL